MNGWTIAWLFWIAFFLVVEGKALFNKQDGDTLSEHVWKWFHVKDPRPKPWVIAARVLLGIGLVWLFFHFTFGWFTPTHPAPWIH